MPSRPVHSEERVETLRAQIAYAERVKQLMNHLHAAENLDQILVSMQDEILSVFDAEHLTIYAIDYENANSTRVSSILTKSKRFASRSMSRALPGLSPAPRER